MTCFPFVRGARRLLFASTCLTLLACRRGHSPPTTAGVRLPQTPVASTLPALPTPAFAIVALAAPELGTFGDLEIRTTASSTIVGVRDGDGSFRAHAPIAWRVGKAIAVLAFVAGAAVLLEARIAEFRDRKSVV